MASATRALDAGNEKKAAVLAGAAEELSEAACTPMEECEQSRRDRYVAALRSKPRRSNASGRAGAR